MSTHVIFGPVGRKGLRDGLLGLLLLVGGWPAANAQVPAAAASHLLDKPAARSERVVIRGTALDDSLNVPIPDLWLYLNDTKYGAVTDAQGAFTFSFPAEWKPVRGGELRIFVAPVGYTFKPLRTRLDWRRYDPAHPLVLHLASAPGRGRPNLHGFRLLAAPVPPPVYPARAHSIRPH